MRLLVLTAINFLSFSNSLHAQIPVSNPQKAEKATDFAPTSNSKEAIGFFNEGLLAWDLGENNKARVLFTKAIEKDPGFGLAYLVRSGTANTTKEYTDDINQGKAKIANASEWEKMYADFLYTNLTGERDKGIEIAKKIADANPDAARAQVDLGYAYFGNNQFEIAEETFKKAVKLNPSWPGGYNGLVNIYLFGEKKDLASAANHGQKAVSLAPNSPGAHITLGDVYRAQNDFSKAKDEYQKAIQLDSKAAEGYYKLGHVNIYMGLVAEARKNYKDAGDRDTRKAFAQVMEATSYGYEGDSRKTTAELLKYAAASAAAGGDKNSNNSDQLNFLALAATAAVHNGDAATLGKIIKQIIPLSNEVAKTVGTPEALLYDQADMLHWEALLDATEGKFPEAKAKAEKMKTILDPLKDGRKLEGYHFTNAFISLKQKNYKEAIGHLGSGDPQAIYNKYLLAKAYEGSGDKTNAWKYYTEVSNYNFNGIDNALVRYEVKNKLKTKE